MKNLARLIVSEECDIETNETIEGTKKKKIVLIKKIKNCKPFIYCCTCFISLYYSDINWNFCLKLKKQCFTLLNKFLVYINEDNQRIKH